MIFMFFAAGIHSPSKEPRQAGLPHGERQLANIFAVADQHVGTKTGGN